MPTSAPRVSDIRTTDWQPKLGAIGEVVEDMDDIDQCIRTILSTPKGSVPHQPDFGSDVWRYLDWPIAAARPNVVREIVDAIALWEPRVEITAVSYSVSADDPATLEIQIQRRRKQSSQNGTVLVLQVAA
jgi:hypothetical protein